MMPKTPWDMWRAHAHITLGWPPHAFWQATPHDLVAALNALSGNLAHGLSEQALQHLETLRARARATAKDNL